MSRTLADAARRLNARSRRPGPEPGPAHRVPWLVLVTDRRLADPVGAVARLPRGAAVILRDPDPAARAMLGRRLAPLCRARGVMLLVSGDWRLAARLGAAGVHLPEGLARRGELAALLGWRARRGAILSVAAHGAAALHRAGELGADLALLSPVFATRSHPGAPTLGPVRFAVLARGAGLPVLALGGLTPKTARRLAGCGVWGVAAIDALA